MSENRSDRFLLSPNGSGRNWRKMRILLIGSFTDLWFRDWKTFWVSVCQSSGRSAEKLPEKTTGVLPERRTEKRMKSL